MKTRRLIALIVGIGVVAGAVASSATLASSGGTKAPKKTYTFYLVAGIASDPFYLTMKKGAQAAAAKLGAKLIFTGSPKAFSPPTQIPYLNAAIARHPDAILIAPTDKTALIAPIKNAIKAGIPVETVDTFINAPLAFTNVSTDNPGGGKLAAQALIKAIGGSGEVAIMATDPGVSTTDERIAGFKAEIAKHPKVKYLGLQYCHDDTPTAARLTSALLAAHPNLKGMFAVNVKSGDGVNTPPKTPYQGLDHFGLAVTGIDAIAADLKKKGVKFTREPTTVRPGTRVCFIEGPQGVSIELLDRTV